jgi:hypothetical protein
MVGCLVPKLSMYQRLAELGDVFGNLGETFIGTELDDKYLQRLGWIIAVGLDEMLKLPCHTNWIQYSSARGKSGVARSA